MEIDDDEIFESDGDLTAGVDEFVLDFGERGLSFVEDENVPRWIRICVKFDELEREKKAFLDCVDSVFSVLLFLATWYSSEFE